MKTLCAVVVGLVILFAPTVGAQENGTSVLRFVNSSLEQTEKALAQALATNSVQLQATAALTIKDLKLLYPEYAFSRLVIPLMRIVKDEDSPCQARVPAAIALHELHSARGDFAIERTALFTDCKHTKHICNWLAYYQYMEDRVPVPEIALTSIEEHPEPLPEVLLQ